MKEKLVHYMNVLPKFQATKLNIHIDVKIFLRPRGIIVQKLCIRHKAHIFNLPSNCLPSEEVLVNLNQKTSKPISNHPLAITHV